MFCIALHILWVTTVMESEGPKEAEIITADLTGLMVSIQGK